MEKFSAVMFVVAAPFVCAAGTYYTSGVEGWLSLKDVSSLVYTLCDDSESGALKADWENKTKYYIQNQAAAAAAIQSALSVVEREKIVNGLVGSAEFVLEEPNTALTLKEREFWQKYYPGIKVMPSRDEQLAVYNALYREKHGKGIFENSEPSGASKVIAELAQISPASAYTYASVFLKAYDEICSTLGGGGEFQSYSKYRAAYRKIRVVLEALLKSNAEAKRAEALYEADKAVRANAPWDTLTGILSNINPYFMLSRNGGNFNLTQFAYVFAKGNLDEAVMLLRELRNGGISENTLSRMVVYVSDRRYRNALANLGVMIPSNPTDIDIALQKDKIAQLCGEMTIAANAYSKANLRLKIAEETVALVEMQKLLLCRRSGDADKVKSLIEKEAKDRRVCERAMNIVDALVGGAVGTKGFL